MLLVWPERRAPSSERGLAGDRDRDGDGALIAELGLQLVLLIIKRHRQRSSAAGIVVWPQSMAYATYFPRFVAVRTGHMQRALSTMVGWSGGRGAVGECSRGWPDQFLLLLLVKGSASRQNEK